MQWNASEEKPAVELNKGGEDDWTMLFRMSGTGREPIGAIYFAIGCSATVVTVYAYQKRPTCGMCRLVARHCLGGLSAYQQHITSNNHSTRSALCGTAVL